MIPQRETPAPVREAVCKPQLEFSSAREAYGLASEILPASHLSRPACYGTLVLHSGLDLSRAVTHALSNNDAAVVPRGDW
jgi:hypothetical protein